SGVLECLRSGWLTTGPRTKEFESRFAEYVGARHAVAVNSCTAALHLALEAAGVQKGEGVVVPTFTFAATAEVVRYFDAVPIFADSDAETLGMSPDAVERLLTDHASGNLHVAGEAFSAPIRAIIPVHYGGQMVDVDAFRGLATRFKLTLIEDAAHTLPAYYRSNAGAPWRAVGSTADITCFSFYANKCITTGEGGMAVTDREDLADRMRVMSLHGMSRDAWKRFMSGGSWYYEIVAPGFKYNLTDIASSIGLGQLARANELWQSRQGIARTLIAGLSQVEELELPFELSNRQHSWHLFPVRLRLERLDINRREFIEALNTLGVGASVHWMPLHMHPYYRQTYGYADDEFPVAAAAWPRLVSLPIFPAMTEEHCQIVIDAVKSIIHQHRR
ncbi:MAG TPA: DegT/DnrJ/EryC1/StrS aminotransferase family protein, partial [Polyangiaceae bacterium]|nr:DegT/DnrJ/EryC1/StrS aminotransferase family protein [Polyangiaceae bacterium]